MFSQGSKGDPFVSGPMGQVREDGCEVLHGRTAVVDIYPLNDVQRVPNSHPCAIYISTMGPTIFPTVQPVYGFPVQKKA